jgi:hypothetical protein
MLDVVDNMGERVLGIRRLRGIDFRKANVYQEFGVDFNYMDYGTEGLEFRVAFRGTADLYLDRVLVTSYPITYSTSAQWSLTSGEGLIQAKLIDGAGNPSSDITARVVLSYPYKSYLPLLIKQ